MTQVRNQKGIARLACTAVTLAMLCASVAAQAGPVFDAQLQMTRASRQYFEALLSSRDRSPAAREKLREQYLAPAEQGLVDARKAEERAVRERLELEAKLAPVIDLPGLPRGSRIEAPATASSKASSPRRREIASTNEPEALPAMDGKDVPREIEFKPGSGQQRKPAAAAVPSEDDKRAAQLRELKARLKAR